MIEWKDKNGRTILKKLNCLQNDCFLCKRLFSGSMYELYMIESFMKSPKKTTICEPCLRSKEFYYLDRNLNVSYNFVCAKFETNLSKELEKQKGQE